jgi:hypothetical protein
MMACRKSVPQAFDVTNQQIAAAVGERKRAEKRFTFDLEPPIPGGYIQMAEDQHGDTHAWTRSQDF